MSANDILDSQMFLRFETDDNTSLDDVIATLYRGEEVIGRVRMDWSHWPFQEDLLMEGSLGGAFKTLSERGRQVRKRKG